MKIASLPPAPTNRLPQWRSKTRVYVLQEEGDICGVFSTHEAALKFALANEIHTYYIANFEVTA